MTRLTIIVELVRLYSNLERLRPQLRQARRAASSSLRPPENAGRPWQHHRRLSRAEIIELIQAYEDHQPVHRLAERFGIHRITVTALLQRHGVELRRVGLTPDEIRAAARLYRQGWSCARLGARFSVDPATVWRALRAAGVAMRSSTGRMSQQ